MNDNRITTALELFTLSLPFPRAQLELRREQLLHTWNPQRYANLTNNPKKYMQAYKQAEDMTRLIESSYALLSALVIPDQVPGGKHSC